MSHLIRSLCSGGVGCCLGHCRWRELPGKFFNVTTAGLKGWRGEGGGPSDRHFRLRDGSKAIGPGEAGEERRGETAETSGEGRKDTTLCSAVLRCALSGGRCVKPGDQLDGLSYCMARLFHFYGRCVGTARQGPVQPRSSMLWKAL